MTIDRDIRRERGGTPRPVFPHFNPVTKRHLTGRISYDVKRVIEAMAMNDAGMDIRDEVVPVSFEATDGEAARFIGEIAKELGIHQGAAPTTWSPLSHEGTYGHLPGSTPP